MFLCWVCFPFTLILWLWHYRPHFVWEPLHLGWAQGLISCFSCHCVALRWKLKVIRVQHIVSGEGWFGSCLLSMVPRLSVLLWNWKLMDGSKFQRKIDSSLYWQHVDSLKCYFPLFYIYPDFIYFPFLKWQLGHLGFLVYHADGDKCLESYLSELHTREMPGGPETPTERICVDWTIRNRINGWTEEAGGCLWEIYSHRNVFEEPTKEHQEK